METKRRTAKKERRKKKEGKKKERERKKKRKKNVEIIQNYITCVQDQNQMGIGGLNKVRKNNMF